MEGSEGAVEYENNRGEIFVVMFISFSFFFYFGHLGNIFFIYEISGVNVWKTGGRNLKITDVKYIFYVYFFFFYCCHFGNFFFIHEILGVNVWKTGGVECENNRGGRWWMGWL